MKNKRIMQCCIAAVLVCALVLGGQWVLRLWEEDQLQQQMLTELDGSSNYDPQTIVLQDTSKEKATELAELLGARLRITEDGSFAALYLPEGVTIRDIVAEDDNREILSQLSIDYQVQVSELTEEEKEPGLRLPSRPMYSVSDDAYDRQSYLDYLNMKDTWNSYTGSGVTVAVIDTGIDTDHPEFAGRISEYSYNATEDKIVKDYGMDWSLIEDEQGHGTAVTGVLAAAMDGSGIVGIAPNVEIIVIKVESDKNGNFLRSSDLVFGLYYAIERDVQVVNMSFGVYDNNIFEDATRLAYDSDVLCVAAAGNDQTAMPCYPAADPLVVGVGALDSSSWELAGYSNYGENVDIVAPGTTYTAAMGGGYETKSGTSLSAPQVAGAIALFLQNNPYITFDAVTEVLYASGYDLGDLGRDWYYGFGALDLSAFLLEERGTVTFEMLTDELENEEGLFIRNHTMQELPEPERLYAVFDGWYYDDMFTEEYNYYSDVFTGDLTLYAKWVNEDDGVPYTYVELSDGTIEIRSYTGKRRFITVPEKIDGKVVSSIGDFAFAGQTRLREVTLPSGLTNIGLSAFEGCYNLVTIQIPANVVQIGEEAFQDNVRLHTVGFSGNRLTTIGAFAFKNCGSLEQIELPASVETVNGSTFFGTTSMQNIGVQNGNRNFTSSDGVLFSKDGGTLVAYPAGRDGEYTIPGSCTEVGEYAFALAKLPVVDLKSVKTIRTAAFINSALEALTIPDGVTDVGGRAFESNALLAQVTIGSGLTKIEKDTFKACWSLSDIQIPTGIHSIDAGAFAGSGLKTVGFASGSKLKTIGDAAFISCAIERLALPDSVTAVGADAFRYNPLTDLELGSMLTSIGAMAFADTELVAVNIPQSVTDLGAGAFAYCDLLTGITVESGNTVYHDRSGVVYTLDNTLIHTYPAGKTDMTYSLEAVTTSVGSYAFAGTGNLDTVCLSEVLVDINEYGFDCSGIDYITIPDSMIRLGRYSFTNCLDLGFVYFNDTSNLARIGYGAFVNCGLTSFTIPASVSTMGQEVFQSCDELTSVSFAANSKLESLSAYVFKGCDNLQTITFEPGSDLISVQAHGLEGMAKLTSIDFGDAKVTNIDNFAFRFCTSLSAVDLPETVTNVGRYAFYGCASLSELALPVSVEHIGSYAFLGTSDLQLYLAADSMPEYLDEDWDRGIAGYYVGVTSVETSGDYKYAKLTSGGVSILEYTGDAATVDLTQVDLGGSITAIGGKAFMDTGVTSVTLPATLTEIQAQAFAYSKLTSVTIPGDVTFIGREAFVGTPITSLTFSGSNVRTIEQKAFAGTEKLTSVTIPESITALGSGVFQDSGLTSVMFELGIRLAEIPQKAFMGTRLESVALPDSVTLVNHNAFNGVTTLKSVTFGNATEIKLMSNAFYRTGLTSLTIPDNVTYIGEFCFVGLEKLTSLTVDGANPNYKSVDGLLLSKNGRKLIAVPAGRTGSLTVPTSVEEIGFGAFERSALSEVKFDASANILTFGCRAFFEAENLTSIMIPASVVSIDYYAFAYCENLETVTFADGNNLKGIYEGAFCGDSSLTDITAPNTIVEISDFAFYGCESLDRIPVEDTAALQGIYDYAFAYTGISGDFTTPENLIDIGSYAFMGIKAETIIVPDTKQKELIIGIGAFEGCNQLKKIMLPFIGASFDNAEITWFSYIFGAGRYFNSDYVGQVLDPYVPQELTEVTIADGISFVGEGGFSNCVGLERIYVPESVTMIYPDAFRNTTAEYTLTGSISIRNTLEPGVLGKGFFGQGLTGSLVLTGEIDSLEIHAFANCANLEQVTLPEGLGNIGASVFSGCTSLCRIEIPDSVHTIQDMAFSGCWSLSKVVLPQSLTCIGEYAFATCLSLTELVIPDNVTRIGMLAFSDCVGMDTITISAGLTEVGENAFANCQGLKEIHNRSGLPLEFGSMEYGGLASCAERIIEQDGQIRYRDEGTGFEIIETPDGFRWIRENGTYTLSAYLGEEDTVTLPETINGEAYTLYSFTGASRVVLPEGITEINDYAFVNSGSLRSIAIPSSVRRIGDYAFQNSGLTELILPEGVEEIGSESFSGTNLKTLQLPGTLTSIGHGAFSSVPITSLTIPDGVTFAGIGAFAFCTDLEEVQLSSGITSISQRLFYECNNLKTILCPSGVTAIYSEAFGSCDELQSIVLGDAVEYIDSNAFADCVSLTGVILPDSLQHIGMSAFRGCQSLSVLNIPKNVSYIGGGAFDRTTELRIAEENSNFRFIDGILYDQAVTTILQVTEAIADHVVIPDGIVEIPAYAFSGRENLQSVVLPDSVRSIGERAFENCTGLAEAVLPDHIQFIGNDAFASCAGLKRMDIPDSVTYLGHGAFSGCTGLENVRLPSGLTEIGQGMFWGCRNLRSVEIPAGVTHIFDSAFAECSALTELTIPQSVTQIDYYAFAHCEKLFVVNNESDLFLEFDSSDHGFIGLYANIIMDKDGTKRYRDPSAEFSLADTADGFRYMQEDGAYTLLGYMGEETVITLPDAIEGQRYTICGFFGGEQIILPEWMVEIPAQAFLGNGTVKQVTLPEAATVIGEDAFNSCAQLQTVKIPEQVTQIGTGAFYHCIRLTQVTFPNALTYLGDRAFEGCISLAQIQLPDALEYLGWRVFYETALSQDNTRWDSAGLVLDGYLLEVHEDGTYLGDSEDVKLAASRVYEYARKLKKVLYDGDLEGATNAETLVVIQYTGTPVPPATLKNVVLPERVDSEALYQNPAFFKAMEGVTVFVEAEEKDLRWDTNFPGWNNGNKVIYGNSWIWVNFYDEDGTLLLSEPKRTSEVIRRPIVSPEDEHYSGELVGWDLDGDGEPDTVPATSAADITAVAVYEKTAKTYTVIFKNAETGEVYSQQSLPYGVEIVAPADPVKNGQIFEGWSGYAEGMTVTGDIEFTARWHSHNYSTEVADPSCTEGGYTTYTCTCGDSYVDTYVDALGHDFGEWYVTKEATEDAEGEEQRDCFRCDASETRSIPKLEHVHGYSAVVTAPNCTEGGFTTYTCSCGDSYVSDETAALGHNMGEWAISKAPTCEKAGEERRECSRCDHAETRTVNATGHDYEKTVTDPTCTEEGYTTYVCSTCGDTFTDNHRSALGHDFGKWYVVKEATEDAEGQERRDCSRCNESETRSIPKLDHIHSYTAAVTAPTCTEDGYTTYTCTKCGSSCVADETPGLGHDFGEWYVTKEATEDAEGEEQRDCSRCDASEIRSIPKRDHVHRYDTEVVDPTCTEGGYTTYTCACGDSYIADETSALGHDFEDGTCIRCGEDDPDYEKPVENPFTDVPAGQWYTDPVLWAVENGITSGTSANAFSTDKTCTRGQVVTFLWRAKGEPEPTLTENPFSDVKASDYFYKAVLWAVENGITSGTSKTTFAPNNPCTRAQVVTFLWRTMDKPAPEQSGIPFNDVPSGQWYTDPILWAVENGITSGTSKTTFAPNNPCTRAQVVTFLYRTLKDK